jgi:uncharacterized delta-60 repeat protein
VALQSDGKIVVAGSSNNLFALMRYNADGSEDATFGAAGQVTTPIGAGSAQAAVLFILPDGKIVAAGIASNGLNLDFAMARYHPDGSLDSTFGAGGAVTTDFNQGDDFINAFDLQQDGKMIAAGVASNDFALARYNPDGTIDSTFGTAGKVTTPIGSADDAATGVAVQADGKIVAAGYSSTSAGTVFSFARYWP